MDLTAETQDQLRDPVAINHVFQAIPQLRCRGLLKSATWLTHIYTCMQPYLKPDAATTQPQSQQQFHCPTCDISLRPETNSDHQYTLAKGYFDMRQYRRAAFTLRSVHTAHARFLRFYSLYLAGEKRKEEERQELADVTEPVNVELNMLRIELNELRLKGELDAHLWYLLGVVLKRLHLPDEALEAFEESLRLFPYNWGVWLELEGLCDSREKVLELRLGEHWMTTLFMAHFLNDCDEPEEARTIYESLLEVLPTSTYLKAQLALAMYNMRGFDEAQQLYDELFAEEPYSLEGMDIYSNILYVKEDKVQLSLLANRCMKIDKFSLETCFVIGNYYSLRREHEQAVTYFQRALKLNRNYLSAWTLMGHEFLEMKNTAAAVEAYRRAIDINPREVRAWYGLGHIYELLNMPLYALYYFQKAAALRPKDARMWCAIGQVFEELSKKDEAIQCYERAKGCADDDGTALSKLAYLYEKMARDALKDGRQQELAALYSERAAQYHLANLTRREEEKLGGAETANALRFLAEHHYAKNGIRLAEKYCYRLMNYPGHDKEFAKKMLRQIHNTDSNN